MELIPETEPEAIDENFGTTENKKNISGIN